MNLITGDKLSPSLRQQVLARFVHRWTHENAHQSYHGKCPGCHQGGTFPCQAAPRGQVGRRWTEAEWHAFHTPLVSDEQWLKNYAFYVTADGRLSERHNYCEPAYMAEKALAES